MLITAIMAASVFSVALTAKSSGGTTDRKVIAGLATRQLSSQLKGYVTSYWDYTAGNWYTGCASPPCYNGVAGPSSTTGTPGQASWELTGAGGSSIADDCGTGAFAWPSCGTGAGGACYALQAGTHNLTGYLPAWFEAAPYCARVSYTVSSPASGGATFAGGYSPTVSISVNWTDP